MKERVLDFGAEGQARWWHGKQMTERVPHTDACVEQVGPAFDVTMIVQPNVRDVHALSASFAAPEFDEVTETVLQWHACRIASVDRS